MGELSALSDTDDFAAAFPGNFNVAPNVRKHWCFIDCDCCSLPAGIELKLVSQSKGVLKQVQTPPVFIVNVFHNTKPVSIPALLRFKELTWCEGHSTLGPNV